MKMNTNIWIFEYLSAVKEILVDSYYNSLPTYTIHQGIAVLMTQIF